MIWRYFYFYSSQATLHFNFYIGAAQCELTLSELVLRSIQFVFKNHRLVARQNPQFRKDSLFRHLVHTAQVNSRPAKSDHMVVGHTFLPQGTAMLHSCSGCCWEQSQRLCRHRCSFFGFCGYNVQSSDTHDTPRSIQMDSLPSGHHQHWTTWLDIADGTRCIVVMEMFLKRQFILSAIDETSVVLITIFVLIVLWNLWKAKIVGAPSSVSVVISTHVT